MSSSEGHGNTHSSPRLCGGQGVGGRAGLFPVKLHQVSMQEGHDIVQEAGIKTTPKKNKCKKTKWLSEEALQIVEKRSERQRRKGKIYIFECRVPKNSKGR